MSVGAGPRAWPLILAVSTALGVLESVKAYLWITSRGAQAPWWWPFTVHMPWWYGWALLTPFAFRLAARWPIASPRRHRAVAVHLASAFLLAAVHLVGTSLLVHWIVRAPGLPSLEERLSGSFVNYFIIDLVIYAAIVGLYFALDYARRWRESAVAAARLEAQTARLQLGLADARLQALRMELNPHFLFNTLNAVSGLVRRQENEAAVRMLARLGDLLRTTLDRQLPQEITLDEELVLLQRYLDIEQARFGPRLTIEVDIDSSARRALVPTLVLQPLVENALRHGVARRAGPVVVQVRAGREGPLLVLEVRDTGRGLGATAPHEGIGLSNTRARLAELFGAAAALSLENIPGGGARTVIHLPFHAEHHEADVAATA